MKCFPLRDRAEQWLSGTWHSCDSRNRIFQLVPRNWSCLVSSYWYLAGRTSMTCLSEQDRGRLLGGRRPAAGLARSTRVPSGGYGGVKWCNSSCWLWKPSPKSLKSQACACTAAGTIHPPPIPLFPQPPCGPLSCRPTPPFQISLSPGCSPISWHVCPFPFILLVQPKFPSSSPPSSFTTVIISHSACLWARLGRESCARRNQVTIGTWFIGMTMEVPKSDTVQIKLNVYLRSQFFLGIL